jgi:hypothetical protein
MNTAAESGGRLSYKSDLGKPRDFDAWAYT